MIEKSDHAFRVTAPMLIANARALLQAGQALLSVESGTEILLDLERIQEVDSSALAVFFGLRRTAKVRGVKLRIVNPPASFISLAGLYGVSDSLSLA